jgi:hypothetical protein
MGAPTTTNVAHYRRRPVSIQPPYTQARRAARLEPPRPASSLSHLQSPLVLVLALPAAGRPAVGYAVPAGRRRPRRGRHVRRHGPRLVAVRRWSRLPGPGHSRPSRTAPATAKTTILRVRPARPNKRGFQPSIIIRWSCGVKSRDIRFAGRRDTVGSKGRAGREGRRAAHPAKSSSDCAAGPSGSPAPTHSSA